MPPRSTLLLLLPILLSPSCTNGGGTASAATATVAPGGTFTVTEGTLAGVKVEVPAEAIAQSIEITADPAMALAIPGFQVAGRAVTLGPGSPFRAPVHVTIPFAAATQSGNENVVLLKDSAGRILELTPTNVDANTGLATFDTLSLGTCWLAERLFLGVGTEEFLPLEDGNQWTFENGLSMALTMEFSTPNFANFVYKLRLEGPNGDIDFYLDRHWSGTTELLGTASTTGNGWQQLHSRRRWLPSRLTLGRTVADAVIANVYEPYGASESTGRVVSAMEVTGEQPARLVTPVATYTDLITVRFAVQERALGGEVVTTRDYAITFAKYVGPVAVEAFGVRGEIVGGIVSGVPIGQ